MSAFPVPDVTTESKITVESLTENVSTRLKDVCESTNSLPNPKLPGSSSQPTEKKVKTTKKSAATATFELFASQWIDVIHYPWSRRNDSATLIEIDLRCVGFESPQIIKVIAGIPSGGHVSPISDRKADCFHSTGCLKVCLAIPQVGERIVLPDAGSRPTFTASSDKASSVESKSYFVRPPDVSIVIVIVFIGCICD